MDNTETRTGIDEVTGLPFVHNDGGFDDDESPSDASAADDDFLDGDFSLEQSPIPKTGKRAHNNEPCVLLNAKMDRMFETARQFGIPNYKRLSRATLYSTIYDHMAQVAACPVCNGPCDPATHLLPPLVSKSPLRTRSSKGRGKKPADTPIPGLAGASGTQQQFVPTGILTSPSQVLASAGSTADQPIGGPETNFVPDQTSSPEQRVNLQTLVNTAALGQEAAPLDSTPRGPPLLSEQDMAKVREAVQKKTDELAATQRAAAERRIQEMASAQQRYAPPPPDLEKRREEAMAKLIQAEFAKSQKKIQREEHSRETLHRQQIQQLASGAQRRNVVDTSAPASNSRTRSTSQVRRPLAPPTRPRSGSSPPSAGATRNVSWADDLEHVRSPVPDPRSRAESTSSVPDHNLFQSMMDAAVANHFRDRSASTGSLQMNLPSDPFSMGLGPASTGAGKIGLVKTPNMEMARRLGIHPRSNLRLQGDTTGMDFAKLSKYLTSGSNKKAPVVARQATWPEECLTDSCPLFDKKELKLTELDLQQFSFGFIHMILIETLPEELDPVLANKLQFLLYMIGNSFSLEWSHLIKTTDSWFRAWEQGHVEWDNWDTIEAWLDRAKLRGLSASINKLARGPGPNQGRGNLGGGGGNAGAGKQKSGKNINGVPNEYFNKAGICMKFQYDGCELEPNHVHPSNDKAKLKHTCAGCWKLKKGPQAHGCEKCGEGPFGKYFQSG